MFKLLHTFSLVDFENLTVEYFSKAIKGALWPSGYNF